MKKAIVIALACLIIAACSSGPSASNAEAAMLTYAQSNAGSDATVSDFSLGECKEADGQPGYSCTVTGKLQAMGGRVNEDISGVYMFGEVNGELRVLGRTM